MSLSETSRLAIELCERLGIPYCYGTGYATLRDVPINEILNADPFTGNYVAYYHMEKTNSTDSKIQYNPDVYTNTGVVLPPLDEVYTVDTSEEICLVA